LQRHHIVLDMNAGTGLLTWEAIRRVPEGGVWALAADEWTADALRQQASHLDELERPNVLVGPPAELPDLLASHGWGDVRFDAIVGRNAFTHMKPKERVQTARTLAGSLAPEGSVCLAQTVPKYTQRIYRLIDLSGLSSDLVQRIIAAEEAIYANLDDVWVNWDLTDLQDALQSAGFEQIAAGVETEATEMLITPALLERWFSTTGSGERPTYARHLLRQLSPGELAQFREALERASLNQTVTWESRTAFIVAKH